MIEIRNASIAFDGKVLLSELTILLKKGEIACITGTSGKGKSSLLHAIIGFVPLCEGTITVDGMLLTMDTIGAIRRKIAWIPQELSLPSEWVREMVAVPFELKSNQAVHFSEAEFLALFPALGLDPELYEKRVSEISGGQRQRIMLAVAAYMQKEILIVDEPTSALDPASVDKVIVFFNKLIEKGVTVLAVSHDVRFVEACNTFYTL